MTDCVIERWDAGDVGQDSTDRTQGSFLPQVAINYAPESSGGYASKLWLIVPVSIVFESPGLFVASVIALPGCVSQGATRNEAKKNLESALVDILDLHAKRGTRPQFQEPDYEVELSTISNIHVNVDEDS